MASHATSLSLNVFVNKFLKCRLHWWILVSIPETNACKQDIGMQILGILWGQNYTLMAHIKHKELAKAELQTDTGNTGVLQNQCWGLYPKPSHRDHLTSVKWKCCIHIITTRRTSPVFWILSPFGSLGNSPSTLASSFLTFFLHGTK